MHGTDILTSWASNKTIDIRVWDLSTLMVTAGKMVEEAGDRVLGRGALSRNTLPIWNQSFLCPELPLYPSTPQEVL